MKSFATIVKDYEPLSFVAKLHILDIGGSPEYTSGFYLNTSLILFALCKGTPHVKLKYYKKMEVSDRTLRNT